MMRRIKSFYQDEEQEWVALLECGHTQHVRHRPPWESRPWLLTEHGRASYVNKELDCLFCDMPIMPEDVKEYKRTSIFTEETVPAGLLKDHQTRAGTWARIHILEGKLLYRIVDRDESWVLKPGIDGIVEPTKLHSVKPVGNVRFVVIFHRKDS